MRFHNFFAVLENRHLAHLRRPAPSFALFAFQLPYTPVGRRCGEFRSKGGGFFSDLGVFWERQDAQEQQLVAVRQVFEAAVYGGQVPPGGCIHRDLLAGEEPSAHPGNGELKMRGRDSVHALTCCVDKSCGVSVWTHPVSVSILWAARRTAC